MSKINCRLTCCNQICYNPIRFRTQACQMKHDRQFVGKLRHNLQKITSFFNLCPLKLWSYCADVHRIFIDSRGIVAAIKSCIHKATYSLSERHRKEWNQIGTVCRKIFPLNIFLIGIAIVESISERQRFERQRVSLPNLLKIGCHGNVP